MKKYRWIRSAIVNAAMILSIVGFIRVMVSETTTVVRADVGSSNRGSGGGSSATATPAPTATVQPSPTTAPSPTSAPTATPASTATPQSTPTVVPSATPYSHSLTNNVTTDYMDVPATSDTSNACTLDACVRTVSGTDGGVYCYLLIIVSTNKNGTMTCSVSTPGVPVGGKANLPTTGTFNVTFTTTTGAAKCIANINGNWVAAPGAVTTTHSYYIHPAIGGQACTSLF